MRQAAQLLVGTHDFSAFSSARTTAESKVRTIEKLDIRLRGQILMIRCRGDGFLYNMARILVGTLIEVGKGKKGLPEVAQALEEKERSLAGPTAPPHGLFLWEVFY
jgi:tRNA pseudouridine38-40 synthase